MIACQETKKPPFQKIVDVYRPGQNNFVDVSHEVVKKDAFVYEKPSLFSKKLSELSTETKIKILEEGLGTRCQFDRVLDGFVLREKIQPLENINLLKISPEDIPVKSGVQQEWTYEKSSEPFLMRSDGTYGIIVEHEIKDFAESNEIYYKNSITPALRLFLDYFGKKEMDIENFYLSLTAEDYSIISKDNYSVIKILVTFPLKYLSNF